MCVCGHPGTQRTPVSVASPERSASESIPGRAMSQQGLSVSSGFWSDWEAGRNRQSCGCGALPDGFLIVSLGAIGDKPLSGHVSAAAQVCCPGDKGLRQRLSRCWADAGGPGLPTEAEKGR